MDLKIDKSFIKSLDKLKVSEIKLKLEKILTELENAKSLTQVKQIKKLQGYKDYYRIKSGDYRIGIRLLDKNTIVLITIAHRKEIYKVFP
ncbi:type II toxin-antitoxin system RelE family toxin [Pedobacter glucosidilyticus]|uniref:type II toxin-antitoxin system RelE family toxin n=1 Tax=Pedobacter glucosidilyticus TaxID=1122941 RepID=UPI0004147EDE|nr:type II toxin-antitoxin system RelE/ParE family toxin [Pedobacter glucosidilyticus]